MGAVGSLVVSLDNGAEIYLGSLKASTNEYLNSPPQQIHFVLNCAEILPHMVRWNKKVQEMEAHGTLNVMRMAWKDERHQILHGLDYALRFVHSAVRQGHSVLIHCEQGKSRSGSVMVAYLMAAHGMSLQGALAFVKDRRPIVHPNAGFMKQLMTFEMSTTLIQLRREFMGGPLMVMSLLPSLDAPQEAVPTTLLPLPPKSLVPPPTTSSPITVEEPPIAVALSMPPPPPPPLTMTEDGLRSLKEGLKHLHHQLYYQQLSEEGFETEVETLKLHYINCL